MSTHACKDVTMDSCDCYVDFSKVLKDSEQVLRKCFKLYKLEELFFSFNGGKDCTALLHMTLDVLKELYRRDDVAADLNVVYMRTSDPFSELEDFVRLTEKHYGLKLTVTEGDMKMSLQHVLEQDRRLRACLMGTRRTDPFSEHLESMQMTDANWPQVMRVSPILEWSYHQIWSYIHSRGVPYCSLYDKGYTSIGSTLNTWPNPALAYTSGSETLYHPAWRLTDGSLERAGRGAKPPAASNGFANSYVTCRNGEANGH